MIAIILIALLIPITTSERSTDIPADFSISQAANSFPSLAGYFKNHPVIEPVLPIQMERKWVRPDAKKRKKREDAEKEEGKTLETEKAATVLVVDDETVQEMLEYIYASLVFVSCLALTIVSGMGLLKTATVVTVFNHFDENKPIREFPAVLSLQIKSKRAGKTPVVTVPPEPKKRNSKESRRSRLD